MSECASVRGCVCSDRLRFEFSSSMCDPTISLLRADLRCGVVQRRLTLKRRRACKGFTRMLLAPVTMPCTMSQAPRRATVMFVSLFFVALFGSTRCGKGEREREEGVCGV